MLAAMLRDVGIPVMIRRTTFDVPDMLAAGPRELLVPADREFEARAMLDSEAYVAELQAALEFWRGRGISGVPSMIFLGRHLVTGAQGIETYRSILDQLTAMATEAS